MANPEKDKLWDKIDALLDIKILGEGLSLEEQKELAELTAKHETILKQERAEAKKKHQARSKTAKKVNKKFKKDEDWGCEQLGLERQGHMKRGLPVADGVDEVFSVEFTRTNQSLSYIRGKIAESVAHATQGRTPTVVIFQDGYDRNHGIVLTEFHNWRDLHGK